MGRRTAQQRPVAHRGDLIGRLNDAASRLGFADASPCHQVFG